ncbi:MAG: hypothetical protein OXI60_01765 [Acidiferrobacterales bacterium]|nr:hypothetical protein [Acidiferrobacterales bacterium]
MKHIREFVVYVGPLRSMLYLLMLILFVSAFFSMGGTQKSGFMMFPTLIAPAIVPMLFFVNLLDATMCKIMMSGKGETQRRRYRHMIWYDLISLLVLFAVWSPFYKRLLQL